MIVSIPKNKKSLAIVLLQDYLKELSNFEDIEKDSSGKYLYKYFDSYWEDKNRFPFFIMSDNEIAGFILVNTHTVIPNESNTHSIAELYIKENFRNKGLGKESVLSVFNKFPGNWEVAVMKNNILADKFWNNLISNYTIGKYKKHILKNKKWIGSVYTFNTIKF